MINNGQLYSGKYIVRPKNFRPHLTNIKSNLDFFGSFTHEFLLNISEFVNLILRIVLGQKETEKIHLSKMSPFLLAGQAGFRSFFTHPILLV